MGVSETPQDSERGKKMKRAAWVAVTALVVAALLLFAGCGGKGTTSESTGDKSSGAVAAQSDVAEGVPIYPGATEVDALELRRGGPAPGGPQQDGQDSDTASETADGQNPDGVPSEVDGENPADRPAPPDGWEPPEGTEAGTPPAGMRAMSVAYRTADSIEKVVAWYKEQLSGMTDFEEATMPSRGGTDGEDSGEGAAFTFKVGDTSKMVMIRTDTSEDGGGTLIMISNAGEGMPQSQPANQE